MNHFLIIIKYLTLVILIGCTHPKNLLPSNPSCEDKYGPSFKKQLQLAQETGLACLRDLSKNGSGAKENLEALNKFIQKNPVQFNCSDHSYFKNNSSTGTSGYTNQIPYISLRPDLSLKVDELRPLIFHEYMHFISPKHGYGIEYTYSCEDCCFLKDEGLAKRLSCELCEGNFKDKSDPKYLNLLNQYVPLSFQDRSRFWLELFARVVLLEKPRSSPHLFLMLDGRWDHDLLGIIWAKFLLKNKIVSDAKWISIANSVIPPEAQLAKPFAEKIVHFMNILYIDGNIQKSVPILMQLDLKPLNEMTTKGAVDFYQWKLSQEFRRHLKMDLRALAYHLQENGYKEQLKQIEEKMKEL